MQVTTWNGPTTLHNLIKELAESPALDACLTWDGANNYRVQAGAKYVGLDNGHYAIVSKSELDLSDSDFEGGHIVDSTLDPLVEWVTQNQAQWFSDAKSNDAY